jgi:TonB family protein
MLSNSPLRNQLIAALLCVVAVSPLVSGQQKNDDGIRLHCKLLDAHAMKIIRPTYPELARQTCVEGRVSLACIIERDGSVQKIEVKKRHPLLIQAATDAVPQWKFKALVLNGQAVEMETTVNIDFQLPKGSKISGNASNQAEPMALLPCGVFACGYKMAQESQEQSWPIKHH